MGAAYQSNTYTISSDAEIKAQVIADCRRAAHDYGHGGYSGTWAEKLGEGVKILQIQFNGETEAEDYVSEQADKWGPLLAVKYTKGEHLRWYVGGWCSE